MKEKKPLFLKMKEKKPLFFKNERKKASFFKNERKNLFVISFLFSTYYDYNNRYAIYREFSISRTHYKSDFF